MPGKTKDGRAVVVVAQREGSNKQELVGICSTRSLPYYDAHGTLIARESEIIKKMLTYPDGTVFEKISRTQYQRMLEPQQTSRKLSIGVPI